MHLIFRGLPVYLSAHAEKRAVRREIDGEMLYLALSKPQRAACVNATRGVWLIERQIDGDGRTIRLVIELKPREVLLVTVMWVTRPSRPHGARRNKRFRNRPRGHRSRR